MALYIQKRNDMQPMLDNQPLKLDPDLVKWMLKKYERTPEQRQNARIFRLVLNDFLICRERGPFLITERWEREVARRLHIAGGMEGDW